MLVWKTAFLIIEEVGQPYPDAGYGSDQKYKVDHSNEFNLIFMVERWEAYAGLSKRLTTSTCLTGEQNFATPKGSRLDSVDETPLPPTEEVFSLSYMLGVEEQDLSARCRMMLEEEEDDDWEDSLEDDRLLGLLGLARISSSYAMYIA